MYKLYKWGYMAEVKRYFCPEEYNCKKCGNMKVLYTHRYFGMGGYDIEVCFICHIKLALQGL